ncbi:MAG TPA: SMC-Scp complex subunit ScpB [candidate division Zixibacteria bacterium]|nr:SMC-Scp complex subunit ScpB [candidate division Zixibacteria bacterium]
MNDNFKISVVESLILASPDPLQGKKIADLLDNFNSSKVAKAVAELNNRYVESGCSFRIRELAGGYQFFIMPEFTGFVQEMFSRTRKLRLTRAALETLAIVAYKQPVTKTDVEMIRGVASDGVIHNLLEKKMLTIKGRAETVGKPLLYGTTDEFLKFFGLNKITELPKMSEIEELIVSAEPQNQTELVLSEIDDESENIKLNVSDDSFEITQETEKSEQTQIVEEPDREIKPESKQTDNSVIIDIDQT